jgi:membrane protein YqaA with SNARE-associated domain
MDHATLLSMSHAALCAATVTLALVSGIIPFVFSIELYLLAVASLTDAPFAAIVGLAVLGQTIAKSLLYLAGKGALNVTWVRRGAASRAAEALSKRPGSGLGIVALSAVVGIPPLYGVSLAAGTLRYPVAAFIPVIVIGRLIRFGSIYLAPELFR